jgi:tetratricopeptide (TPR) repeat protein
VKVRFGLLLLAVLAIASVIFAGCGDSKKDDDKKGDKGKATSQNDKIDEAKRDALKKAKASFKKKPGDSAICRDLAMRYIAVASPESPDNPKEAPKLPKVRDKNLKGAVKTLESCTKINAKDRDIKQMLASTYMATGKFDKASALLKDLAQTAKGADQANAYYAWGLAASNAQQYPAAITAWTKFSQLAPAKDPRVKQIKQSIVALRAAAKAPKTPAATTSSDDSKKDDKDN